LGVGLTLLTLSIILTMHFDRYRSVALGIKYAGWSCSGILFPKLLAFLEQEYGFRDTLLIFGAISLNIPTLTLLLKEAPGKSLIVQNRDTAVASETSSWNYDPHSIGLELAGRRESDSSQCSGRGTKILELMRKPMFFETRRNVTLEKCPDRQPGSYEHCSLHTSLRETQKSTGDRDFWQLGSRVRSKIIPLPPDDVRYDMTGHFPEHQRLGSRM
ncbi:monocarboxylate transporter, putative, partial [Ixodes scapularis]